MSMSVYVYVCLYVCLYVEMPGYLCGRVGLTGSEGRESDRWVGGCGRYRGGRMNIGEGR